MSRFVFGLFSVALICSSLLGPAPTYAQPASAAVVQVSADAEVAAALYGASATQAAIERQYDARLRAQRDEIEALRLQVALGADEAGAEITGLRAELARRERAFVEALAARDRVYAQEIAVFRDAVEDIASTPEGLRALALFNDGDELGAIAILDDLRAARDAAREVRINIESAVEARRIGVLALEARINGKLITADLIARYDEITRLDPGVHWDWVELGRLYRDAGDLTNWERTAQRAAETATDDRDQSVALNELGDVQVAQGDLTAALASYGDSLAIAERLAASDPGNAGWQRDLSVSYEKLGDVQVAQGDLTAALASYGESLAIAERLAASDPGNAGWQRDVWVSLWRIRRFPGSDVSWADIVARMEAMETSGTLLPTDMQYLQVARAQAAAEAGSSKIE